MVRISALILFGGLVGSSLGLIVSGQEFMDAPVVKLSSGTFTGNVTDSVDGFYGLPYAAPPIGNLRLRPPVPVSQTYPDFDATRQPPACSQHGNPISKLTKDIPDKLKVPEVIGQEDCLTLDIVRPTGVKKGDRLPVVFWIFAGGFTFGYSTQNQGNKIIKKSVGMKQPIIFVTINHRLNIFGFLGGKEVQAEGIGNLGLLDQRMALQWVQANIEEFGGDPSKVTIAGASSGAMSVVYQMMAKDGDHEGLFRAAISESGTPFSTGLADGSGQAVYDALVRDSGCTGTPDTLECLRSTDYQKLITATSKMPESVQGSPFILTFFPRIDGKFVTNSFEDALSSGKVAKVALLSGDEDDEGTGFGLLFGGQLFKASDLSAKLQHFFPNATSDQIQEVLQLYHFEDVTQGSPFDTGFLNVLSPYYKQFSAITGDIVFQAPRRLLLRSTQSLMTTYGYIDRGLKTLPIVGSVHAGELTAVFGKLSSLRTNDFQSRWVSFITNLDPNYPGLPRWETYGPEDGQVLEFKDWGSSRTIPDTFRSDGMNFIIQNLKNFRLIAP